MPHYTYLIIGGGMTANAAVNGIRSVDSTGSIGILSSEAYQPYNRPPLSKALWKGSPLETIWAPKNYDSATTVHLSTTALQLDPAQKQVVDHTGTTYTYDKLLLATGGTPRRLPFDVNGIIYFRTLDDYYALRNYADSSERFVVIGGGFIGSEIAAALATNGKQVTMVFPESGIGARVFPQGLSSFLCDYYRSKGVQVLSATSVVAVERDGSEYRVRTSGQDELKADCVVAGIGIMPNIELAQQAGIATDNGIIVDEYLRTSAPDVYAAGDVANFFCPALGKRIRVEHEDNALTMGSHAGKNMAGASESYTHLPMFYSDLFDLGYEAVGELDSSLEVVEDWKEAFHEGVVYYLERGRVRGVLLWNTWEQVDNARQLITEPGPIRAEELRGRLPA